MDIKAKVEELEATQKDLSKELKKIQSNEVGSFGMTPDHIKALPEWKNTKQKLDTVTAHLLKDCHGCRIYWG